MPRAITNLGTLATKYTLKFSGLGYVNSGYFWEYQFLITTLVNVPGTFTPFYLVPKKKKRKSTRKAFFLALPKFLDSLFLLFFSHPVISDSLQPHGLQYARPLWPSLSPKVCPSSCPVHRWCHPATSSSHALFFWDQSFPTSGSFPVSQWFTSYNQNTRVSASASVFRVSTQGWFNLRLTGLILLSTGLPGDFSSTTVPRHQFFSTLPSLQYSSHYCMWALVRP